jgi:hypothetical protein
MARNPAVPWSEVIQIVPHIIAWAAREHCEWFWKGCDQPYVDPRREPVWDPATGYLMQGPLPPGAWDSYCFATRKSARPMKEGGRSLFFLCLGRDGPAKQRSN